MQKQYYQDNKEQIAEKKKQYNKTNKEYILEQRREYCRTPSGKIACNKYISKRRRNLGYNVLNPYDSINPEYVGHHIDTINVMFIPKELHNSVWHSVIRNINMDKINSKCFNWYNNK